MEGWEDGVGWREQRTCCTRDAEKSTRLQVAKQELHSNDAKIIIKQSFSDVPLATVLHLDF